MTASEAVKEKGLKNLAKVSSLTGVSSQTLNNWFNNKPELFEVVIRGCVRTDLVLSCVESLVSSSLLRSKATNTADMNEGSQGCYYGRIDVLEELTRSFESFKGSFL